MEFDTLEKELLEALGGYESTRSVKTLIELGANPDAIVELNQISHVGSNRYSTCRIVAIENILYSRDQKEYNYEDSVYVLNLPIRDTKFKHIVYQAFDNPNYDLLDQFETARQISELFGAPFHVSEEYETLVGDEKHDHILDHTNQHEAVYGPISQFV